MSRVSIRNAVIEATGRSDKTDLINSAINTAVSEVSAARIWSDLLVQADATLTAGNNQVTLASDVLRVLEIRVIDGTASRPLMVRPKVWVVGNFPNPSASNTGSPVWGYLEGLVLSVVPIPNANTTLRYTYARNHPPMSSDSSTVLIRHTTAAVTAYATFWVFQALEQHESADRWLKTFFALLEKAKKIDVDNPVVKHQADLRGSVPTNIGTQWWNDPFVQTTP